MERRHGCLRSCGIGTAQSRVLRAFDLYGKMEIAHFCGGSSRMPDMLCEPCQPQTAPVRVTVIVERQPRRLNGLVKGGRGCTGHS